MREILRDRVLDLVLEARDASRLREMPREMARDSSRFLEIVPSRKSLLVNHDGIHDCNQALEAVPSRASHRSLVELFNPQERAD